MAEHSDAFVFFGATGDLAHKQIFPALQSMIRRGHLNMPIIGVAKSTLTLEQLRGRARDSVEKHGELDVLRQSARCVLSREVRIECDKDGTVQPVGQLRKKCRNFKAC